MRLFHLTKSAVIQNAKTVQTGKTRLLVHTLAQKILIELLMWNASNVQKTPQLNLTGNSE